VPFVKRKIHLSFFVSFIMTKSSTTRMNKFYRRFSFLSPSLTISIANNLSPCHLSPLSPAAQSAVVYIHIRSVYRQAYLVQDTLFLWQANPQVRWVAAHVMLLVSTDSGISWSSSVQYLLYLLYTSCLSICSVLFQSLMLMVSICLP
jgi:hypothetical protein